jgi:hypothetical protein
MGGSFSAGSSSSSSLDYDSSSIANDGDDKSVDDDETDNNDRTTHEMDGVSTLRANPFLQPRQVRNESLTIQSLHCSFFVGSAVL